MSEHIVERWRHGNSLAAGGEDAAEQCTGKLERPVEGELPQKEFHRLEQSRADWS